MPQSSRAFASCLHLAAVAAVLALPACGSAPGDSFVDARSPLVNNQAYPNVAAEVAARPARERAAADVATVGNEMMSLTERPASPSGGSVDAIADMQRLAKRNRKLWQDAEAGRYDE